MFRAFCLAFPVLLTATAAQAQGFTTAAEVRPIIEAQRATWVGVREYNGQDLLYFTALMAWRCGLSEIRYGLNGASPVVPVPMEPCHEGTAAPNAMTDPTLLPYIALPLKSVDLVSVEIVYDDGQTSMIAVPRAAVQIP